MEFLADFGSVGDGFLGFFKSFFGYPAILIGIFAMIGAIAQKRKGSEILISTLKTIIGFLIISGGAAVLTTTLGNLSSVIQHGFKLGGGDSNSVNFIIPTNEAMMAFMQKSLPNVMSAASIILILAMLGNILLAKYSNWKYIYLTGHVAFYMSLAVALGLFMAGLRPMDNVEDTVVVLISGGLFMGFYMILSPALSAKMAEKLVGNDKIVLGHTGGFGCAIAGVVGTGLLKISRKDSLRGTEELNLPKKLEILKNNLVSLSVTMVILYMVIMMIALGVSGLEAFDTGKIGDNTSLLGNKLDGISYNVGTAIVFSFVQALTFVSGIQIIMFGVKMFLEELVPAFGGIASKLIKGSRAAVEVQAFWPAAPNATILGMISSFGGGFIAFGIMTAVHFSLASQGNGSESYVPMVLPELFPHLFIGGTAAVFANKRGGVLAAILAPLMIGFVWAWFPVIYKNIGFIPSELHPAIGSDGKPIENTASAWAEVDHIITLLPFIIVKYLGGKWVWLGVSAVIFAAPIAISQIVNAVRRSKGIYPPKSDSTTLDDIKSEQISLTEKAPENEHSEMPIIDMDNNK